MGLRVNTNIASMTAQRNLSSVTSRLQGNYSRLSSGLRIATAADDAAGLAISEKMRSQIRSYSVAGRNAADGISMVQTAEGALNEVSNILSRMRELSVQASNGTMSTTDQATTDVEFQALLAEIDRVASSTEFNSIALLDGSAATVDIQVGIDAGDTISVGLVDTTTGVGLSIAGNDVLNVTNAQTSITALDAAIDTVNSARGSLGASQNRLQSVSASIMNVRENLSAAESRIRDVDVAFETADLTRNSILQQAAVSVLSQANVQPQLALSLLG
ncbi:MAG: flagellin [Planctomycetota bacterium]|jgi:flagellin|nr:flagellin FliC [Planctomycetota bacterium]MDP6520723.1 flagellin [Planctomycetota bacterium]MDP6955114.1 flagellin [Planctomycetota bacterium]